MASPAASPMSPGAGSPPSPGASGSDSGPSSAAQGVANQPGAPAQAMAKLAMDAQKIAQDNPETAPMMREIQNQVRMATMKMIQMRQQAQQQTPQI